MLRFFQRLPIATRLWLLISVFALVGVADNLTELALINKRLHVEKETQLKHLVEAAHSVLQAYERAAKSGRVTEQAARAQAAEAIRQLHYGPLEYFWIHDLSSPVPAMVMHPTVPELDGKVLAEARFDRATSMRGAAEASYRPVTGGNLFVAMNRAIAKTGDGFVAYDWPKPRPEGGVTERLYPKLSYVKRFDAWGWVVGSGIYIDDLEAEYWRDVQSRLVKAALWLLLLGLLAWFVLRTVVRPMRAFQDTVDRLRANPNDLPQIPKDQPGELGRLASSFVGLMEDLRRSRNELGLSIDKLRRSAKAFANMKEGVLITDPEGRVLSSNPAFSRQTGYEPEELIGQTTALLRSDRHDASFYGTMWQQLQQSGQWTGTIWNRAKDGSVRPQWVSLLASRDADGRVRCYVGLYSDVDDI